MSEPKEPENNPIYIVDGVSEIFDPEIVADYVSIDDETGRRLPRSTPEGLRAVRIIGPHGNEGVYVAAALMRIREALSGQSGIKEILYRNVKDENSPGGVRRETWTEDTTTSGGRTFLENQEKIFSAFSEEYKKIGVNPDVRIRVQNNFRRLIK